MVGEDLGNDKGFRPGLPAAVVGETFDLEGWALDAVDYLGGRAWMFHDVKPVTVFELLGGGELAMQRRRDTSPLSKKSQNLTKNRGSTRHPVPSA
jgi:hypothetical protein